MRRTLFRFTVTAIALITLGSGCGDGATTEEPGAGDPSGADPAGETTGTVPPAPSVVHVSMAPTIDGVIAYYALDGDAMDGGPEAIDGVIVGTSGVADRFGIPDGAIAFSSLDDYIHFPEAMLAERLASMTLSLWFQTSADDRGVLFDEGVKSGPGFQFRMQPGKDVFAARSGGL